MNERIRLRFVAPLRSKTPPSTLTGNVAFLPMEAIGDDGVYDHGSIRPAAEVADSGYTYFERGDVVRARVTPCFENGKGAFLASLAGGRGVGTTELFVFRPSDQVDAKFLYYVTVCREFTEQGASTIYGAHGVRRVDDQFVRDYGVWLPTLATQRAVASGLDRETLRIDKLIAAKRRMIGLLEERAIAFIEDSALSAGWRQVALGRIIRRIEQGWSPQCDARLHGENEWGVLKVGCVNHGEFRPNEVKALPADLTPRLEYLVRDGDLLMSRANTRDLVGGAAVVYRVRPRTLLCDKLYRLRLDERRVTPRFVALWLQTRAARDRIELEATGASDSMQNIGQDTVGRVAIPLPDLDCQEAFVSRCERERAHIGKLVGSVRTQIDLLQERRQALITAAVTGQLDIPEAA